MRKSEKAFWNTIRERAEGKWVRVENAVGPGTPDCCVLVNGVTSWVELKRLDYWQSDLGLRKAQRAWLMTWYIHGGRCYVFANIKDDYILIPGNLITNNHLNKERWMELAPVWEGKMNWEQLTVEMSK